MKNIILFGMLCFCSFFRCIDAASFEYEQAGQEEGIDIKQFAARAFDYSQAYTDMKKYIDSHSFYNISEVVAFIRHMIHENSIEEDNPHGGYADIGRALQDILATIKQGNPPPAFSNFDRAIIFDNILRLFNISSSYVYLGVIDYDLLTQIVMLNVKNPQTGRWELHDVSFDCIFVDESGEVLQADEVVGMGVNHFTCKYYDGSQGWPTRLAFRGHTLEQYFGFLIVVPTVVHVKSSVFPVNQKFKIVGISGEFTVGEMVKNYYPRAKYVVY